MGTFTVIRRATTSGTRLVRDIAELVDLEARGVEDVSAVVRAVPAVPWRVALFARDVVIALAAMPARDARPWRAFRSRFADVHSATTRPR